MDAPCDSLTSSRRNVDTREPPRVVRRNSKSSRSPPGNSAASVNALTSLLNASPRLAKALGVYLWGGNALGAGTCTRRSPDTVQSGWLRRRHG